MFKYGVHRRDLLSLRDLIAEPGVSNRRWKLFEHHWEQYTMMSATLPWLRSTRVGTGGGLASPGYKMISLGYKFQAETPTARSPPFLLVTTLLRPLRPSFSSSRHSFSFSFYAATSFSFIDSLSFSLPLTFSHPRGLNLLATLPREIYLPLALNQINRIFR